MIGGKGVLAVIPARGGSKGLPRKNVLPLGGKPLIGWSIDAARGSRHIDRVVISTEDAEIAAAAWSLGCETVARPANLATDDARIEPALIHALDSINGSYEILVLLQPTSPLRAAIDIDGCLAALDRSGAPSCITVSEPAKSPYWTFRMAEGDRLVPLLGHEIGHRRQELPAAYAVNGAVYAARSDWLRRTGRFIVDETIGYVMPRERAIDIDTALDMVIAEACLNYMRKEPDRWTS